jgi:hypothetical protein
MRRRALLGSAAAVGAAGLVGWPAGPSQAATTGAQARGGSNYCWYGIDGCNLEPYGVIKSFHNAPDVIRSQLAAMRAAGQARLRVPIIHRRRPDTGTVMDSTGGDFSAANRQNLTDLLRAIADAGFAEIQVTFMPIGENAAWNWPSWNGDIYQENWNLIYHLHPIIAGAGIQYRIDLCNEAVPTSAQPVLLTYTQRLWTDYTNAFGKNDTCGFSIIANTDRIAHIPKVYGNNPPYLFDFHFYRPNVVVDEGDMFTSAHQLMNQYGYTNQGWTISEAYYDDPTAAHSLRQAIDSTGRTVFYLLQWPVQAPRIDYPNPTCPKAIVPPPVNFGAYIAEGF